MNLRIILFGLVLFGQLSCSDDDDFDINSLHDDKSITTLNGTWKVISFEDFNSKKVEFKNNENSWGTEITVSFDDTKDPHSFSGTITTNGVNGEFNYIMTRKIKIKNVLSTLINQPEWGNKFVDLILNEELNFIVNSDRLRIYNNDRSKSVTFEKQ